MLGSLYADGRGCTVDMNKSFYWIKKSAENGSVKGACYLSYSYEVGAGCEKNQALAEYWDKVSRERIESMISEL
jgi:TPR repeat protein